MVRPAGRTAAVAASSSLRAKAEFAGKALRVLSDGLIEGLGRDAARLREIRIRYDAGPAEGPDAFIDPFGREL